MYGIFYFILETNERGERGTDVENHTLQHSSFVI